MPLQLNLKLQVENDKVFPFWVPLVWQVMIHHRSHYWFQTMKIQLSFRKLLIEARRKLKQFNFGIGLWVGHFAKLRRKKSRHIKIFKSSNLLLVHGNVDIEDSVSSEACTNNSSRDSSHNSERQQFVALHRCTLRNKSEHLAHFGPLSSESLPTPISQENLLGIRSYWFFRIESLTAG